MKAVVLFIMALSTSKGDMLDETLNEMTNINAFNCGQLPDNDLKLDISIDFSLFSTHNTIPIYISNVFSRNIDETIFNGTLDPHPDWFFYNFPQTGEITGLPKVFSTTLAFERRVFRKYDLFAPKAVNENGTIVLTDLAQVNDYTQSRPYNEWYNVHTGSAWDNPKTLKQSTTYRDDTTTVVVTHRVDESDGEWIQPYYDCTHTFSWLFSYSVPLFSKLANGTAVFEGVTVVDFQVRDLDVNQCDTEEPVDAFFNSFKGTHKCPKLSQCIFRPGLGFQRGGYFCKCNNGASLNGYEVEQADESTIDELCKDAKLQKTVLPANKAQSQINTNNDKSDNELRHILDTIANTSTNTCVPGTSVVLDITPDYSPWERHILPALFNANYMSLRIHQKQGTLGGIRERSFYRFTQYAIAAGLPEGKGYGLAFEPGLIPGYGPFAPYSVMIDGEAVTSDMSSAYNYLDSIWYEPLAERQWTGASSIPIRTNLSGIVQEALILYATPNDGQWTQPYFDCGRNNIWMVTYSAPILKRDVNGDITFEGVAIIDIDMTDVDINQCDMTEGTNDAFQNTFRGTHKCPPFTKCVFEPGFGFKRGGYTCLCGNGNSLNGELLEDDESPAHQQIVQECYNPV